MSETEVSINGIMELIEFLNRVRDPNDWRAVDKTEDKS